MNQSRRRLLLVCILVAAFVLHTALADDLMIGAARPNLGLACLLIECLWVGPNTGAALGLILGLLEAAYAGQLVGSLIVCRSAAGFAVGALENHIYRDNAIVASLTVLLGTAFSEGLLYLFAPQPAFAGWANRTIGQAAFNALLALPAYFLLRRFLRQKARGPNPSAP